MKKIVLSIMGVFTVSMAPAQSYISQPDPSTYEVREYKPAKKTETPKAQPAQDEAATQVKQAKAVTPAPEVTPAQQAQPAARPKKEVVQNRKKK